MLIPFIICFILTMGYAALMLAYRSGWEQQSTFSAGTRQPSTPISIIIPARNEAANIGNCIKAILAQDYPKALYEVIVIDDHSTDDTAGIVKGFNASNVRCLSLSDFIKGDEELVAYKKKALAIGIENSTGELIVTTDADCIAQPAWLRNIASLYEVQKPVMIVAPVDFISNGSLVETFQSLDFMTMQGITAAVHRLKLGSMSNGANLAFSREAYQQVEGYTGIDHLASGDDFLLMAKLQKQYHDRIGYLKSEAAIVTTRPQPDWSSFFSQRIRWASKSGKYDDKKMTAMLSIVYVFNLSFLAITLAAFFYPFAWGIIGIMLLWKILAELYFIYPVAVFFGKTRQLFIYPLLQPLHILYVISAGFLGMIGKYQWKGRSVR